MSLRVKWLVQRGNERRQPEAARGVPARVLETTNLLNQRRLFGAKRLRLSANAIELPPGGAVALVALLQAAHVAAVGVTGVAMKGAGENGWGAAPVRPTPEQQAGFDPDAALARYMARKAEGEPEPMAEVSPIAAPAASAMQARPAFGRKGL